MAIIFALLVAVANSSYGFAQKMASSYVNQVFGAIVVSATAVVVGLIVLAPQLRGAPLYTSNRGLLFLLISGVSAFCIDYFTLQAYSRGLPITIVSPIVIGGSIALSSLVGFAIGESFTLQKILGLGMIFAGALVLSVIGK